MLYRWGSNNLAKVLVVDDTEAVLESLAILLSKGRHDVHLASDLESACRVLAEEQLDIVIMGSLVDPKEVSALIAQAQARSLGTQLLLIEPDLVDAASASGTRQLAPPLSAEKLLAAVEEVARSRPARAGTGRGPER